MHTNKPPLIKSLKSKSTYDQEFEEQVYNLFFLRKPEFPQVYECPKCGRLAVFACASDTNPTFWFQRERTHGEPDSLRSLFKGVKDS